VRGPGGGLRSRQASSARTRSEDGKNNGRGRGAQDLPQKTILSDSTDYTRPFQGGESLGDDVYDQASALILLTPLRLI
jgi:hypothetical protein